MWLKGEGECGRDASKSGNFNLESSQYIWNFFFFFFWGGGGGGGGGVHVGGTSCMLVSGAWVNLA